MHFAHRSSVLAHCLLGVVVFAAPQVPATTLSTALSAAKGQAAAPPPLRQCEPLTLARDKLSVVCALADAATAQAMHIKVHLTGSHDDTTASLEVTIGGTPVACAAGSKTSTEAEDGDVTLDCRFTASVKSGSGAVLRASAKWFHAQYVGIELNGHRP
jgi:hypothetical protein